MDFLAEMKPHLSEKFENVDSVAKLAYLANIFDSLNKLKTSIQGTLALCLRMVDKIEGHKQKLDAWKSQVLEAVFSQLSVTLTESLK